MDIDQLSILKTKKKQNMITISWVAMQICTNCGRHEVKQKRILVKTISWLLKNWWGSAQHQA
jgi:hypothetical protein